MSEWDFYDAREGARSIYVTPIMPCGRAVLPLAARGVGAEPWVDGRARIGREILVLSDRTSVGKGGVKKQKNRGSECRTSQTYKSDRPITHGISLAA